MDQQLDYNYYFISYTWILSTDNIIKKITTVKTSTRYLNERIQIPYRYKDILCGLLFIIIIHYLLITDC